MTRDSLCMISLPNSGSTWLAETIAAHSRWNRYAGEFFNPLRNRKHYGLLSSAFGCELIDCFERIAESERQHDLDVIDRTWPAEDFNFTKEVFSPFKLRSYIKRFRCFVLVRMWADTFPAHRARVWSFYEHAWWALKINGYPVRPGTLEARATDAFTMMRATLIRDAEQLGVPVIHYRDLFIDAVVPGLLRSAIGECSADLARAIAQSRHISPRDERETAAHRSP
jgi:hypothetical protein